MSTVYYLGVAFAALIGMLVPPLRGSLAIVVAIALAVGFLLPAAA